jgi:hypothetical protein
LNNSIENPSTSNDRKAWKAFKDLVRMVEQIEDEYEELIEIRNTLRRLRKERNWNKRSGRYDLADKAEAVIQSNYVESINIIKEVREKLPWNKLNQSTKRLSIQEQGC